MPQEIINLSKSYCIKNTKISLPCKSFRDSVNRVPVQHSSQKIKRHPGTKTATRTDSWESTHEVLAFHIEQSVEVIVFRYEDLVAVRILQVRWPMATFLRVVSVQRICKEKRRSSIMQCNVADLHSTTLRLIALFL